MEFKNPTGIILYLIEQAIKEYRKISQYGLNEITRDITIDQCLVLMILTNNEITSQKEVAELIFKDYASVTRMIEFMVKKNYLVRSTNEADRRKSKLIITNKGKGISKCFHRKLKKIDKLP